jgi:hypothetical protein
MKCDRNISLLLQGVAERLEIAFKLPESESPALSGAGL